MTAFTRIPLCLASMLALALVLLAPRPLEAGSPKPKYQLLYSFQGQPDGANPFAGLIMGTNGILYGTTKYGGAYDAGSVFSVDSSGKEAVIHSFPGSPDGQQPVAGLTSDSSGNFYGTTEIGGTGDCPVLGCGTVFKVDTKGTETVLYSFVGGMDGSFPVGSLIVDQNGSLYGTTSQGGSSKDYGTVFKLDQDGTESVLYSFTGRADGASPQASLIFDPSGNLYGTADSGGKYGHGVVFKLAPQPNGTWVETVLYSYKDSPDGAGPVGSLTWDEKRNLYGTTVEGGIKVSNRCRFGCGTVFELSVNGKETVLFRFRVGTGKYPEGAVIRDATGNLYGTAPRGGTRRGNSCCGLVFRVSSAGKETLLYKFTGGADGNNPSPNLLRDAAGNFYGTAEAGGQFISGTVFKLIP